MLPHYSRHLFCFQRVIKTRPSHLVKYFSTSQSSFTITLSNNARICDNTLCLNVCDGFLITHSRLSLIIPRRNVVFTSHYPEISIPDEDLYTYIKKHYLQHPNDELFVDGTTLRAWTASELVDAAEKSAGGLAKRGFGRGDVACLFCVNCPEFVVATLAVKRFRVTWYR